MRKGMVRGATCQFAVSSSIRRNSAQIQRQMRASRRRRADIVHFSECALSGYAGEEVKSWKGYDWDLLKEETQRIMTLAARLEQWVVLGSSHYLGPRTRPHNSLYLISPAGKIINRYDKRFCTAGDLKYYSCGDHHVFFTVNGIRCCLLICFDVRFPEVYRDCKRSGAQLILQSFYNARASGPGIHTVIMRATMQVRAATNALWMSGNNSSGYYGSWPSVFIQPDGRIVRQLPFNRAGVMVNTVDASRKFYDPSSPFRERAMRGVLWSRKPVSCRRSRDRKCL